MKSAIGIGALMMDGLGDTIRVSLTEDPEYEIDPCKRLAGLGQTAWTNVGVLVRGEGVGVAWANVHLLGGGGRYITWICMWGVIPQGVAGSSTPCGLQQLQASLPCRAGVSPPSRSSTATRTRLAAVWATCRCSCRVRSTTSATCCTATALSSPSWTSTSSSNQR